MGMVMKSLLILLWVASAQDDPELERLREAQREARTLLKDIEQTAEKLKARLSESDSEAVKKIERLQEGIRQGIIKEEMEEVERRIASNNLLSAIRKVREVIKKLDEILDQLLGLEEESKSEVPKLSEIRKTLDELIDKQEKNRSALEDLRGEVTKGLDDFLRNLEQLGEMAGQIEDKTGEIPDGSLIDLLKQILKQTVRSRKEQEALIESAQNGESGLSLKQERLRQETEAIDEPMTEALKLVHNHSNTIAHKTKAVRDHLRNAVKGMGEAASALKSASGEAIDMQGGAREELKIAENLLREVIEELEARRRELEKLKAKQDELTKNLKQSAGKADKFSQKLGNQKAQELMKDVGELLRDAGNQSNQAAGQMQQGQPSGAAEPQKGVGEKLQQAQEKTREAVRRQEGQMSREQAERLKQIGQEQRDLAKQAGQLQKQMGQNSGAQGMKNAEGQMNQAANKMGSQQSPQGGQQSPQGGQQSPQGGQQSPQGGQQSPQGGQQSPQGGQQSPQGGQQSPQEQGNRDLGGAQKNQEEALREMQKARDEAQRQEQEQMLSELEQRLLYMIEEQKKINAKTLDLDNRKETMGELTRTEKLDELKPAAEKQLELSSTALEAKSISEGSDAPEIGWAFGMVASEMKEVSKLLDDNQTGALTQRKERFILQTLQSLLQAVREKKQEGQGEQPPQDQQPQDQQPQDQQPQDEQPQDQQPQEEQQPQQPSNDPLGVEAEIRLLIELQKHLRWETQEMGKMAGDREELSRSHRELVGELKARQTDLVDRLRKVIPRLEGSME